jgi:LPS-assembly protein
MSGQTWRHITALAILLTFSGARSLRADTGNAPRPQRRVPAGSSTMTLEADQQSQKGKIFYADGNVDIRYDDLRLRADHVEFNDETKLAIARGHVQFDRDTQHLEGDAAQYNLRTGEGKFQHIHGAIAVERRPNPNLLLSPNPVSFEAQEVERVDERTYVLHNAWLTVCDPDRPKWKFYAPKATIRIEKTVALQGANFRLFSIPVIYLPYATLPAGRRTRQSGFLIPEIGNSSSKGFIFGDSFYWAPVEWMDAEVGAAVLSKRGWSETASFRARPWEGAKLDASYFAVEDRGLPQSGDGRIKQGGHEYHIDFDAFLPQGWRAVANVNGLSSSTFQLAFGTTFSSAVNLQGNSAGFLTNNFRGFSVNFAAISDRVFLSASPETSVTLRRAPEARFSSVDQAPWSGLPVYFSFDVFTGAVHRAEEASSSFETPAAVQRSEIAPSVTIPLRWGPWLGVTPSFTLRSTRYGARLENGAAVNQPFIRTTEEFSLDFRPPSFERIWDDGDTKWKHVIEPDVVYRFVNGVNQFGRFILFDEDDTLTDTNEVEYSVTQRLFRRSGSDNAEEFLSWRVAQKYFFDPTFGGALVPGQRNMFQAFETLTPFAFAEFPERFSPVVSDLRVTPGGRYDAQLRVDYDPKRGQMTAIGELLKMRPYREAFITLAHFSTVNLPPSPASPSVALPSRSNQVQALLGYGDLNRPGWNSTLGMSYDVTHRFFQNEVIQVSYNGSCCGLGFEFRRLALGSVRSENQFRVVLLIANLGSAGNLRRREKIF